VVGLLAALLAMALPPEEFVVRPGAPHKTAAGIVFTLEERGHKHGEGGLTTGRWTLKFSKGVRSGKLPFSASGPEDFYGEGYAFGSLFRLMGQAEEGGLKVVLGPRTAEAPREARKAGDCEEVLEHESRFAPGLPEGVSLSEGVSLREGTGACVFSPDDGTAVVVVGKYSLEVLYARKQKPPPGPIPK
jgi:hypothetical protein